MSSKASLVVYIAVGAKARMLCRLSAMTLRSGGYDGDIRIISDAPVDAGPRTETVILPPHCLNLDMTEPRWGAEFDRRDMPSGAAGQTIKQLTPLVPRFIDLRPYDLVVQMDVDIVANADIAGCFDALMSMDRDFAVSLNTRRYIRQTSASCANLTRWERLRYRNAPNINSGLFAFRPSARSLAILRSWQRELMLRIKGDQSALQAVYLRHHRNDIALLDDRFQAFAPLPEDYDGNPVTLSRFSAHFVHFRGAIYAPRQMQDYIRRFGLIGGRQAADRPG